MSYRLERRAIIPASLAEVFTFFENPRNLETLTPPWLGFRILDTTDEEMKAGTMIRYQLRLHGIPLQWTSRITEYVAGERFADEQLTGPYRRWYHRHVFRAVEGGVEMTDWVEYEMPFGILGRLAHAIAVRRQLHAIFDFRTQQVIEHFSARHTPGATSSMVTS